MRDVVNIVEYLSYIVLINQRLIILLALQRKFFYAISVIV